MRSSKALSIAIAAVLGALAVAALPALAGAKDDHGHHRGDHRSGEHHHHHGASDSHQNAGRISAFDAASGQLTIARFGGGSITGLVTSSTEIKCEGAGVDDHGRFARDSGNSGPGSSGSGGDNGSRGEEEPGDDHGEGAEPGDDNGGRGEEEPGDDHGVDNNAGTCTTADLTVGTVVREADSSVAGGVASFEEIKLGQHS